MRITEYFVEHVDYTKIKFYKLGCNDPIYLDKDIKIKSFKIDGYNVFNWEKTPLDEMFKEKFINIAPNTFNYENTTFDNLRKSNEVDLFYKEIDKNFSILVKDSNGEYYYNINMVNEYKTKELAYKTSNFKEYASRVNEFNSYLKKIKEEIYQLKNWKPE